MTPQSEQTIEQYLEEIREKWIHLITLPSWVEKECQTISEPLAKSLFELVEMDMEIGVIPRYEAHRAGEKIGAAIVYMTSTSVMLGIEYGSTNKKYSYTDDEIKSLAKSALSYLRASSTPVTQIFSTIIGAYTTRKPLPDETIKEMGLTFGRLELSVLYNCFSLGIKLWNEI